MPELSVLLEGLGQWDYEEAHKQISLLGEAENVTRSQLLELLDRLPIIIERYSSRWELKIGKELFDGNRAETLIWTLGESFRRILKRKKALRSSTEFWSRIEAVGSDPRFGKGRESFTMLLGQYGGRGRVPTLLRLLDDPQVQGHALYSLRLLRAAEARARAEELLASPKAWVRAEARKYLRKCVK